MRKNLCVGILDEQNAQEKRSPLTPADAGWLIKRGVDLEVEKSTKRIFCDSEFKSEGARIVSRIQNASLILGVKNPRPEDMLCDRIYMVFSHVIKGQEENIPILKECLRKKITLIDYEKIADNFGRRLVYFGRFAGVCGLIDSLCYFGKKIEWEGIKNPFSQLRPCYRYKSLDSTKRALYRIYGFIKKEALHKRLSPFIIGITGHGHVSQGVQEILDILGPVEIHPRDMLDFIKHKKTDRKKVYKIVFLREEKLRAKNGKGFYFEDYLKYPEKFESNLDIYLSYLNILIHTSYWDMRYPRLVTKKMIGRLYVKKPFRLKFIGDISCDINGSIELTYKTTTFKNPTFTYNPRNGVFKDGHESEGITIMAIDNLPSELPKDASCEFSSQIKEYVYQIACHGALDITHHAAIPAELRRAVITQKGHLTRNFRYLRRYL